MELLNKCLIIIYFLSSITSVLLGSVRFKYLSSNLKILLVVLIVALAFDLTGFFFYSINIDTNYLYLSFDFLVSNIYLKFYIKNIFPKCSKYYYLYSLIANGILFLLCYKFNHFISDFDFKYSLITIIVFLILGLKLFWIQLNIKSIISKQTLQLNSLFLYFILMGFINKFLTYFSYMENKYFYNFSESLIYIYNIFGFAYAIKLFISKNEN
jgi:hypothetical protein